MKLGGEVAFDVWSDGKGGNAAWLLSGGALHAVDLATGTARKVGAIAGLQGRITDFAVLPTK